MARWIRIAIATPARTDDNEITWGDYVFAYEHGLAHIDFYNKQLASHMFYYCDNLLELEVPADVIDPNYVEDYVFAYALRLVDLEYRASKKASIEI